MARFAIGSLFGSVILGVIGHKVRPARAMIFFALVWHAFFIAFVFVDQSALGMILMGLAGLAHNLSMVPLVGLLMRTFRSGISRPSDGGPDVGDLYAARESCGGGLAD